MIVFVEWAKAYARQAAADLRTWDLLHELSDVSECHQLLFLQMACEKLTKAHLCSRGSDPKELQSSHAYVSKNLPIVIRQQMAVVGARGKTAVWILRHVRHLAREIEMLAPAVKRGGQRPDNCEYPWEDASGRLHVPLDWRFAPSNLLHAPAGRTFLKLLREAIERFESYA
ncbi:MAG: hypothetical protein L0215_15160 [Gemmataceae bacterium]|nr:hypothetical protein [Gemmataceae bacterium]